MTKNNKDEKKGKIRVSTLFLLMLLFYGLTTIIIPDVFFIPITIIIYIIALKNHWLKPFKALDFLLIMIYLIISIALLIHLQILLLSKISWFQIIIIGFAADIVATILGHIPIIGDFISGIINFITLVLFI